MNFEDVDLNAFLRLEPEDTEGEEAQEVAEPAESTEDEGGNEQEVAEPAEGQGEMSPEKRHENAARRRAAELDKVRQEERERAKAESDAFVKSLGLKNPYDGNKPIETKEQYDAYKRAQGDKALERGLSSGKLTVDQFNAAVDARIAERTAAPAASAQQNVDEVRRQYAEIQALDPEAPSLDELAGDEAFTGAVRRTGSMVDAYKLLHFDELQARQAQAGKRDAANRAQEKAHLQRTGVRGSGSLEITESMRQAYRVFDPDITDEEIRKYEQRDSRVRKT